MRKLITKLLREHLFYESSRKTIHDINDLILFSNEGFIMLYNPITKTPVGYISGGQSSMSPNAITVRSAYSTSGYGPLLYELLMTQVYPVGVTLDDSSETSKEALNVWSKFNSRSDVKKELINRTEKSPKEKELIYNCKGDVDCLKRIRKVLDLHDLKFSYNLGKSKLEKLKKIGDEYLNKNTDLDIEEMIHYLEKKGGRWD